jgi:hypothetical protein
LDVSEDKGIQLGGMYMSDMCGWLLFFCWVVYLFMVP